MDIPKSNGVKMTPLEYARAREGKIKYCDECPRLVIIENVHYCEETGKLILPMFLEHREGMGPCMGCSMMRWKFEKIGGRAGQHGCAGEHKI